MQFNERIQRTLIVSGSIVISALLLVGLPAIFTGGKRAKWITKEASAQTNNTASESLPPIPEPAIKTTTGSVRQIVVSNRLRREPLQLEGSLKMSEREYGDGLLKITNVSQKAVMALRGEWLIYLNSGDILREGWSMDSSSRALHGNGGILTGETIEVPVGGPIASVVDAPGYIRRIGVRVTGVAFADKSWWGDDGLRVFQRAQQQIKVLTIESEKLLALGRAMTPQEFEIELNSPIPQDKLAQASKMNLTRTSRYLFLKLLCKEDHTLREDYLNLLEEVSLKGKAF
jgi:hypothetical protein